ncbi:Flp pilus assembly protein CpaB [Gellertiella hungarica]|uniref:Pilus assembly protein CpaB n=1 Tax=Gellertiella hungarica TaxID=1572859 RepID=A0A7W6NMH3_9HYPH|nr:Flp pilus assembly protein CpaB [Gellertiella hungarica]MBB4066460.1 pilus assembly protein CpaB [Gellertiella hungarica]
MKPARIIILGVAVATAGLAGVLAMKMAGRSSPPQQEVITEREPTVNVLVAAENLPTGTRLQLQSMNWAAWPESSVTDGSITDTQRPNAIDELKGSVVRLPIFAGEPMRAEKIVDGKGPTMSSMLPAGKRAVATEISVATGAGGFILPNDRVDVIMVRKADDGSFVTETVLTNIRVLAIDQQIEEKKDETRSVVGATATLELTPDQARVITVAQQMAQRLSLALRSVADSQEPDTSAPDYLLTGSGSNAVQVIKAGNIVKSTSTPASQ